MKRLKVLSRVMHATSSALFDRALIVSGARCLDIGCGSGDITRELARRAGPNGAAVGADIDETKLQLAKDETEKLAITNVEVAVVQPMGLEGEVKLLGPLTMEAIVDAAIAEQLTTNDTEIIAALYEYAADSSTLAGTPRIVQSWGRKS